MEELVNQATKAIVELGQYSPMEKVEELESSVSDLEEEVKTLKEKSEETDKWLADKISDARVEGYNEGLEQGKQEQPLVAESSSKAGEFIGLPGTFEGPGEVKAPRVHTRPLWQVARNIYKALGESVQAPRYAVAKQYLEEIAKAECEVTEATSKAIRKFLDNLPSNKGISPAFLAELAGLVDA
jgi:phage-related tail protein